MKHVWDMSKYISFVFHQKSARQEVKSERKEETRAKDEEEEEEDYREEDDPND